MGRARAAAARALQRVSRVAARRPKTKVEGPCAPPGQSEGVKIYARGGGPLAPVVGVGCVVGRLYAERISVVRKGVALERGPRTSRDHQSTIRR